MPPTRQYQVWMFSGGSLVQLRRFLTILPFQAALVGLLLAPLGLWRAFRTRRDLGVGLLLLALGPLLYAINYSIPDIDSYFVLTFATVVWLAVLGGGALVGNHPARVPLLFVLPALALALNWSRCDQSGDVAVEEYVRNEALNLEPGAILVSADWEHFDSAFWYRQRVTGFRPDVTLVNVNLLRRTWYPAQLQRWYPETWGAVADTVPPFLEELERFESGRPFDVRRLQERYVGLIDALVARHVDRRPVYVSPAALQIEPAIAREYLKVPAGLVLRVVPKGAPAPPPLCRFELDRILTLPLAVDDQDTRMLLQRVAGAVQGCGRYASFAGRREEAHALDGLFRRLASRLAP